MDQNEIKEILNGATKKDVKEGDPLEKLADQLPLDLSDAKLEAKGDKGEIGPQGPVGVKGDRGEKGPQGDQGPAGPQGEEGDQGDQGDRGSVGLLGPKGDQGEQGYKGKDAPWGKIAIIGAILIVLLSLLCARVFRPDANDIVTGAVNSIITETGNKAVDSVSERAQGAIRNINQAEADAVAKLQGVKTPVVTPPVQNPPVITPPVTQTPPATKTTDPLDAFR